MKIEWIHDLEEFRRLREPWNELVSASETDHAWMRHEWIETWVRNLGDPRALSVAVGRTDGQLVAAAPLQARRTRVRRVPVRELGFLSSGVSPRCGFLVREPEDADALFAAMTASRSWDLVVLRNLPMDVETSRRFVRFVGGLKKRRFLSEPGRRSPYFRTHGTWDAYWRGRPGKTRSNANRGRNRMKRAGHTHEIVKIEDGESLAAIFGELLEASARSWKGKEGTDLGSQEGMQRLYLDFSRVGQGLFELWVLRVDGRVAAFDVFLRGDRSISLIRTDYDESFRSFNPGNLLRVAILQDLFDREGLWEYDMGGQDYEYKMHWADRVRSHEDIVVATGTARGRLALAGWKLATRLAALRRRRKSA